MTGRWTRGTVLLGVVAAVCASLAGTAAARVDSQGASAAKTVNVGFLYSKTGGLSVFGSEIYDGFRAGLDYTKGKCGGYTINPTYIDDATDPATAITAFKNQVGQGTKIIAGTASSGIALQLGPLAAQNNVLYITPAPRPTRSPASTGTRSAPAGRRCRTSSTRGTSSRPRRPARRSPSSPRTRPSARATSLPSGDLRQQGPHDRRRSCRRSASPT